MEIINLLKYNFQFILLCKLLNKYKSIIPCILVVRYIYLIFSVYLFKESYSRYIEPEMVYWYIPSYALKIANKLCKMYILFVNVLNKYLILHSKT